MKTCSCTISESETTSESQVIKDGEARRRCARSYKVTFTLDNILAEFGRNLIWLIIYLVGSYYAGLNSTPAPLTPALITPRQNLGLSSLRAAFNTTVRKI